MARRAQQTIEPVQQGELFETSGEVVTPVCNEVTTGVVIRHQSPPRRLQERDSRYLRRADTCLVGAVSTCMVFPLIALIPVLLLDAMPHLALAAYGTLVTSIWILGGRWLYAAHVRHFEAARSLARDDLWREAVESVEHLASAGDRESLAIAGTLLCHPRLSDRLTPGETTDYLRALETDVNGPTHLLGTKMGLESGRSAGTALSNRSD